MNNILEGIKTGSLVVMAAIACVLIAVLSVVAYSLPIVVAFFIIRWMLS